MKRISLVLSAIAFAAIAASPADASYKVVRWTSGFCQVWNDVIANPPIGGKVVSRSYKTMAAAERSRSRAMRKKRCR